MKKLLALMAMIALMATGMVNVTNAQEGPTSEETTETMGTDTSKTDSSAMTERAPAPEPPKVEEPAAGDDATTATAEDDRSFHQLVKELFLEGGANFMSLVLICMILGLAFCIERILYLNMATTNTSKLIDNIESALQSGGVESAKEVCRNTSGPVASIFYQGLERANEGPEMVEKSVVSYGGVQMGLLERGLSWIGLFIALAPMLGFFGTVFGMIQAFDQIAAANNISPGIVAGGIGVALITTLSGLLVAMILQVFYNYIVAKIDSLVIDMEDKSIMLVDLIIKHGGSHSNLKG